MGLVCKCTNMLQPLAPILASKREHRRGHGIYSFPWPGPSLFPSQWKNAQNRAGVGVRGEKKDRVSRERKLGESLGEMTRLLGQGGEREKSALNKVTKSVLNTGKDDKREMWNRGMNG